MREQLEDDLFHCFMLENKGGMVMKCLAMSPHKKKDLGLNLCVASAGSHCAL